MHASLHTLSIRLAIPLICLIAGAGVATIYTGASAQSTGYTCMPAPGSVGGPAVIPGGGGGSGGGGSTGGGSVVDPYADTEIVYSGSPVQPIYSDRNNMSSSANIGSTPLVFNTRTLDPDSEWDGSKLTAKRGGWYSIRTSLDFSGTTTYVNVGLAASRNGAAYVIVTNPIDAGFSNPNPFLTYTTFLAPGETLMLSYVLNRTSSSSSYVGPLSVGSSNHARHNLSITRSYEKS